MLDVKMLKENAGCSPVSIINRPPLFKYMKVKLCISCLNAPYKEIPHLVLTIVSASFHFTNES